MKTLLLSAPKDKNAASGLHRTFSTILASNIGPEYAIYANLVGQISLSTKEEGSWMQAPIEVSRRGVEKCFCLTSSLIG
jgi:hypothetical protein